MSGINPSSNPTTPTAVSPTSTAATSEAAVNAAMANEAAGASSMTTVTSTADLQTKAPEVWKAMLQGIAMNVIGKMRDSQQRIHEMNREAERENRG